MTTQLRGIDLTRLYTSAEYALLPDDGNRYELIDGRLRKMPPAGDEHGRIGRKIIKAILAFDAEEKLGSVWFTTGFILDADNTPEPDLLYIVASRFPAVSKGALQVIPDLVVEVWSPSQLTKKGIDDDSLAKIRKYQKAEVKVIWSINPTNQTVSVYYPASVDPAKVLTVADELDGENIIPGFKVAISKLFG
jgi:Uma2 family endonuclease